MKRKFETKVNFNEDIDDLIDSLDEISIHNEYNLLMDSYNASWKTITHEFLLSTVARYKRYLKFINFGFENNGEEIRNLLEKYINMNLSKKNGEKAFVLMKTIDTMIIEELEIIEQQKMKRMKTMHELEEQLDCMDLSDDDESSASIDSFS